MSRTVINVSAVIEATRQIDSAKTYVGSAKGSFIQTKNSVDGKIQNRSNIRNRLNTVQSQLTNIDSKIGRIRSTVQFGANQYRATDEKVDSMKKQMSTAISSKSVSTQFAKWERWFKTTPDEIRSYDYNENAGDKEAVETSLKIESKILKVLSNLVGDKNKSKSNDLAIMSSAMSYISGLYTFLTTDCSNGTDLFSSVLKFSQNSATMWNGTYKYLEKNLTPLQASKFGKKFQGKVGVVSLVGSICGFSSDTIDTFKVLMNKESSVSEKVDCVLNNANSGLDVAQSAVNIKYGQKVLTRGVTAKYQWGVAAKNVSKLDNATACISVLGVTVDSIKGANIKHSEVTADGHLSAGDMGEIGISTSVHGLTSVVGKATFGLSDAMGLSEMADEITEGVITFAETDGAEFVRNHDYSSNYVKNAQFLMDYANDESNNIIKRTGAASIAGLGMIGAITVDGISDGVSWMGTQLSSGWNAIKSIF